MRSFPFFGSTSSEEAGSSRKVVEANKGLGEAPKSCTRKEHENATNSIAKKGQGGTSSLFVCPLQGQGTASLVGGGATPQLFHVRPIPRKPPTKAQAAKRPCPNFARPQTRPQAALPPRFRDEPQLLGVAITKKPCRIHDRAFLCLDYALPAQPSTSTILWATIAFTAARAGFRY